MKKVILLFGLITSTFAYCSTNEHKQIEVGNTVINTISPSDLVIITSEHNELHQMIKKWHTQDQSNQYYFDYFDLEYIKKNQNLRMCSIFASKSAFNLSLNIEQFQLAKETISKAIANLLSDQNFLNNANQNIQKQLDSNADTVGAKLKEITVSPIIEFFQDENRVLYFTNREDSLDFLEQKILDKEHIALGFLLLKDKIINIHCKSTDSPEWNKKKLIEWSSHLIEINKKHIFIQIWDRITRLIIDNWLIRIIFILLLIQIAKKLLIKNNRQ